MSLILKTELFSEQVIRFTLNAPKANVLDSKMMTELQSHLIELKNNTFVKLIQFTGEGVHFSFGASVAEHTKENAPKMLTQFHQLFYTLADLSIPTSALISGQCLGGALELALACNFIFIDDTARLGQPEINLGVFAPPASLILPMKVGQARADDLLITGRSLTPGEAENWGIVTKRFSDRSAMISGVDQWCEKYILQKSASSLKFAAKAGRWHFNRKLKKNLKQLQEFYINELMNSEDGNEGIQAFMEKRNQNWKGR